MECSGCLCAADLCVMLPIIAQPKPQVDPGIYRTYCAAFCGLYHTCKKNNKVRAERQQNLSNHNRLTTAHHDMYLGKRCILAGLPPTTMQLSYLALYCGAFIPLQCLTGDRHKPYLQPCKQLFGCCTEVTN